MRVSPRGSAENAERFGTKKGCLLDVFDDIAEVHWSLVDAHFGVDVGDDRCCQLVVVVIGAASDRAGAGVDLANAQDERVSKIIRCEEEAVLDGRMSTLHCIVPFASGGKKA